MSKALREHIRSNIVGYIAIFMFAIGGTAYATDGGLPGQNQVGSADIIDNDVKSVDVRDDTSPNGGLTAADLAPDSVGVSEIAPESVGSSEIARGSITAFDLAASSVFSTQIANGQVLASDIAPDAVNSSKVANDSLGADDLAADSVGSEEIATNAVGPNETAPNSVGQSDIVSNGVGNDEISVFAVGNGEIAPDAVTGSKVADGSLTSEDLSLTSKDLGVFFAHVTANGSIDAQSGGVTATKTSSFATYTVDFGRSVTNCAYVATPGHRGNQAGTFSGASVGDDPQDVFLSVADDEGVLVDSSDSSLIVVC